MAEAICENAPVTIRRMKETGGARQRGADFAGVAVE